MKVTTFNIDTLQFKDFILQKEIGLHSSCVFSFAIDSFEEYSDRINTEVKIVEDDRSLMLGIVDSIEYTYDYTQNIITVTIHSLSSGLDVEKKTRVFQKQEQKYQDIINTIAGINNIQVNVSKALLEQDLNAPIVQNNETDYAFLKRVVEDAYNEVLIVDDTNNKNNLVVGFRDDFEREIKPEEIHSLSFFKSEDREELRFSVFGDERGQELRQHIDIGKRVIWENKRYVITALELKKTRSVYNYICKALLLQNKQETNAQKRTELRMFLAKVINNEDEEHLGRVQLEFVDPTVEDMSLEGKMWFDVLTPYTANTGGFVFLPDKGDMVELVWDGATFYVLASKRSQALEERYHDVSLKQIGNLFEKNICFSEESLELSSKETKVILEDDKIVLTIPNKSKVVINSDIVIDTDKTHIDANVIENNVKKKYTCESKSIGLNATEIKIEGKNRVSIN